MKPDSFIKQCANPEELTNKWDFLREKKVAREQIDRLSDANRVLLIRIIDISDFLYRLVSRYPEMISLIGTRPDFSAAPLADIDELIRYKYRSLLQISGIDLANTDPYQQILLLLSTLADRIIQQASLLVERRINSKQRDFNAELASLALGKLGANELNYSSDIDLVFVAIAYDFDAQQQYTDYIQKFCKILQQKTDSGFLYRVDLNLRPWGKGAPLVLDIDSTEQYYEASKETWERLAWLRARWLTGNLDLANQLLKRLKPFVFHRALSTDDIERFLQIKSAMAELRAKKSESWNIKTGEGGIRDIEFFVHLFQIINGARVNELQVNNTLDALTQLHRHQLIDDSEYRQLKEGYIFLRKLEHRVQMRNEQQTHLLPEDRYRRMQIACSMVYKGQCAEDKLAEFSVDLLSHRKTAKQFFERILDYGIQIK